jgi:tetratricopeptide (TPR) repeat protein
MRAYVLTDARLGKLAGRFAWLEVDTEKPENAAFLGRFPIEVWPTLLVVDPATEQVVLRWAGTATAAQIERLALDAERALSARRASAADEALARADRLAGERRHADAAAAYAEAIAKGGRGWAGRERATESRVQALGMAGDAAACVAAAEEALPTLRPGPTAARTAAQGISCAGELEDGGAKAAALRVLEPRARKELSAPGVLADDRSWLYDVLSEARAAEGDEAGAKALAGKWLSFVEAEAAKAATPAARSALDGQRVAAALRLGDPARALPAVQASARDLPNDFVPPSLLAVLYLELGRPADALASADRALALAKGPRRVRVGVLRAKALAGLGRTADARAALEATIREGEAMPEATRPRGWIAKAKEALEALPEGGGMGSR